MLKHGPQAPQTKHLQVPVLTGPNPQATPGTHLVCAGGGETTTLCSEGTWIEGNPTVPSHVLAVMTDLAA